MASEGPDREETEVWRCEFCEEQVGTSGGEPDEDCPCGNNEWQLLVGDGGPAESGRGGPQPRFPNAQEGDTLSLEVRTPSTDGSESWETVEASVVNAHDDGSLYLKYSRDGNPVHADLHTILGYGDARLVEETRQQSLTEVAAVE